jgi:hypothetical protein
VEAINDLYRHELRWWMNLYLPSVKLVKKVRVGSKVRRVYDAAQTPLERVLAGAQARPEQMAELKKLRQSLDPFELGKAIDGKLERIYDLANRRLSPPGTTENRGAQAKEKTQRGQRNGCGKAARRKSPKPDFSTELGNRAKNARFPLSHSRDDGGSTVTFPMSRRQGLRLHS